MRTVIGILSLTSLFAACAVPSRGANISFTYQTIFDPAANATRVFGINDAGTVSGDHSGTPIFTYANGTFTQYSMTDSGGALLAYDTRINNAGDLVGTDSSLHAFYLPAGGTATQLSVPNATLSFGSGINNTGMIVGGFYSTDNPSQGFTLKNGIFDAILPQGATYTELLGVNDAGDLVGDYGDSSTGTTRGFIYHSGAYTAFDGPGGNTHLWGINNSGNLAGNSNAGAFFYDGSTFSTILPPGAQSVTVQGINNLNQVVGYFISSTGVQAGFIATPGNSQAPEPGTLFLTAGCMLAGLGVRHYRR